MCLNLRNLEERTLATGEHAGFAWHIVRNDMGYRCGYVRVGPGHPWFEQGYDAFDAEVHGGLTFADYGTACPTHGELQEWWVGFDCAHVGDAPDPTLMSADRSATERVLRELYHFRENVVRDTAYVRAECESLCLQALAAAA